MCNKDDTYNLLKFDSNHNYYRMWPDVLFNKAFLHIYILQYKLSSPLYRSLNQDRSAFDPLCAKVH